MVTMIAPGRQCAAWLLANADLFVAALRCDRIEAPCLFDGPIDGVRFLTYVKRLLLPTLEPGDVVITATNFVRAVTISAAIRGKRSAD